MMLWITKLLKLRLNTFPKTGTESMKRAGGKALGCYLALGRSCRGTIVDSKADVGCSAPLIISRIELKRMARVKACDRVELVVEAIAARVIDAKLLLYPRVPDMRSIWTCCGILAFRGHR